VKFGPGGRFAIRQPALVSPDRLLRRPLLLESVAPPSNSARLRHPWLTGPDSLLSLTLLFFSCSAQKVPLLWPGQISGLG